MTQKRSLTPGVGYAPADSPPPRWNRRYRRGHKDVQYLYMFWDIDHSLVKVGITQCVRRRWMVIETASGRNLAIRAIFGPFHKDTAAALEKRAHKMMKQRVKGEWFNDTFMDEVVETLTEQLDAECVVDPNDLPPR